MENESSFRTWKESKEDTFVKKIKDEKRKEREMKEKEEKEKQNKIKEAEKVQCLTNSIGLIMPFIVISVIDYCCRVNYAFYCYFSDRLLL